MRPGEGASPAPRWGPHPSGPLREAPLGAPYAELAAPLPRGRRAGAEPRSWRQRRGRPGTTRAPLGSPERPPPATWPLRRRTTREPLTQVARRGRKGRAPEKPSLKGARAVSAGGSQPKSCPSAPPGPASAPTQHPPGSRPARGPGGLARPLPAAWGMRGGRRPSPRAPAQRLRPRGNPPPTPPWVWCACTSLQVRGAPDVHIMLGSRRAPNTPCLPSPRVACRSQRPTETEEPSPASLSNVVLSATCPWDFGIWV